MTNRNLYTLGGLLLIAWGIANSYLDILRYGMEWGAYWWFCNLALFGIGAGLLFQHRGLLTSFVSIAVFTQTFWLADNILHQFNGQGPFGLVDFMYRPGYPMDEFLLAHYHYFTVPLALFALCFLPKKSDTTLQWIAVLNPLIFAVSYFVFPSYQNINCIHRACFPGLSTWQGPLYAIGFWAGVFLIHWQIGKALVRFFAHFKLTARNQRFAKTLFANCVIAGLALSLNDVQIKSALPTFTCANPIETDGIRAGCQYTRTHTPSEFMLNFYVENTKGDLKFCEVKISIDGHEKILNAGTTVDAHSRIQLNAPLDNPTRDTTAVITTKCDSLLAAAPTN